LKNIKRIFTKAIATELIVMGNDQITTEIHKDDKKRLVYVFKLTEKLLKDLSEITDRLKKQ